MAETLKDAEDFPDSFWLVDFMRFNPEGRPIEGTSWKWNGIVFNARTALEKALDALVDAMPDDACNWRCVRIAMDLQAVVAKKQGA